MMHEMGWGVFGMGFPFLGLIPFLLLGVGFYFLIRRIGTEPLSGSRRNNRREDRSLSPQRSPSNAELFQLAKRRNGVLTVSEVVAETGIDPQEAEKLLDSLADGNRVVLDVDENGVVTYRFRELMT